MKLKGSPLMSAASAVNAPSAQPHSHQIIFSYILYFPIHKRGSGTSFISHTHATSGALESRKESNNDDDVRSSSTKALNYLHIDPPEIETGSPNQSRLRKINVANILLMK